MKDKIIREDSAIKHYQELAPEYDTLSKVYGWISPQILFGLAQDYVKPGQKLLDIGIGTGQSSAPFKKLGLEIFGIDGSEEMLKVCRSKNIASDLKLVDLNQGKIPYENAQFDHIISSGVFYFFKDLNPFFKEAKRLLKPKGIFSFTVEDSVKGEIGSYLNRDNNEESEKLDKKAGVRLFTHPSNHILTLAKNNNFKLIQQIKFLAYYSSTEDRDVWFKNYLMQK